MMILNGLYADDAAVGSSPNIICNFAYRPLIVPRANLIGQYCVTAQPMHFSVRPEYL